MGLNNGLGSFTNPEMEIPIQENKNRSKFMKKTQSKGAITIPPPRKISVHRAADENRDTLTDLMVGPSGNLGGLIKNKTLSGVGQGVELGYKKTLTLATSKLKSMGINNPRMIKAQSMISGFQKEVDRCDEMLMGMGVDGKC